MGYKRGSWEGQLRGAVERGNLDMVQWLADQGADILDVHVIGWPANRVI